MKRTKRIMWSALGVSLLWLIGVPAFGSSMPMFTECPAVGAATGCQVLITIKSGGALSFQTDPSQPSFDPAGDDTLVGVLNDSGALTYSISLSGNNIFQFDVDGACSGTYTPSPSGCSGPLLGFNAPTTYEGYDTRGNFDSFSPSGLSNGMIFFANGLTPGDSAFFSLQGTPRDINGLTSGGGGSTVPEPTSFLLMGTGLLGLLLIFRKRYLYGLV